MLKISKPAPHPLLFLASKHPQTALENIGCVLTLVLTQENYGQTSALSI